MEHATLEQEVEYICANLQCSDLNSISEAAGLKVPRSARRLKKLQATYLLQAGMRLPIMDAIYKRISDEADRDQEKREAKAQQKRADRKAKHDVRMQAPSMPQREADPVDEECFLDIPSLDELKDLYQRYFHATGNESLRHYTCAVCGRSRMQSEVATTTMALSDIPNKHRLKCNQANAKPVHINGLLIAEAGCLFKGEGEEPDVNVCKECLDELKKGDNDPDHPPPRFSFANGLWYGKQPPELTCLTLPELLLIGMTYPRAFLIKLQPRRGANRLDPETLQNALVGNVIAFEQNTERIAEMTEGNIMPRKSEILAELITIALVSVGPLHKSWLNRTFRVRRYQIWAALLWLKANNWYYKDIVISEEIMRSLPEDDVPDSIMSVIRREDDPNAADREREGYDPTDNTASQANSVGELFALILTSSQLTHFQ